jgi:hypothetical protein
MMTSGVQNGQYHLMDLEKGQNNYPPRVFVAPLTLS